MRRHNRRYVSARLAVHVRKGRSVRSLLLRRLGKRWWARALTRWTRRNRQLRLVVHLLLAHTVDTATGAVVGRPLHSVGWTPLLDRSG
jgi:hypothetical protein